MRKSQPRTSEFYRYGMAAVVAILAVVGQYLAVSWVGPFHFLILYPSVLFVAWELGLGPALFGIAIETLLADRLLLNWGWSINPVDVVDLARLLTFTVTSVIASFLMERTRRSELRAQEALKLRDEVLSQLAHEAKTPLTSISLQLQLAQNSVKKVLASEKKTEGELRGALAELARAISAPERRSRKLAGFIDDLLDMTRIDAGKLTLVRDKVNLETIIRESMEQLQGELQQKPVSIWVRVLSQCEGRWDSDRLIQVVVNLLSNALKYGNRTPITLTVEADLHEEVARLIVEDRGPGINPEVQSRIFERFDRGGMDGVHSQGTGLGLWIARQIVEAHDGRIRVESEPGQGARFIVELPLAPEAAIQHPMPEAWV